MIKNRVGEVGFNNYGSKMVIEEYNNCMDIWVKFIDTDNLVNAQYSNFVSGSISNPYDRTVYGIGYLCNGKYKVKDNGKHTKHYTTWFSMIQRCYSKEIQEKHPTYRGCSVVEDWHNFQIFAQWYDENYYTIEENKMCLDKDILVKGNKLYSPNTCVFVPSFINNLLLKNNADRGELPIGVCLDKRLKKYEASCSNGKRKYIHLGRFQTPNEAFQAYKNYKEKLIKEIANEYKDQIPQKLYYALMNYIVEITD